MHESEDYIARNIGYEVSRMMSLKWTTYPVLSSIHAKTFGTEHTRNPYTRFEQNISSTVKSHQSIFKFFSIQAIKFQGFDGADIFINQTGELHRQDQNFRFKNISELLSWSKKIYREGEGIFTFPKRIINSRSVYEQSLVMKESHQFEIAQDIKNIFKRIKNSSLRRIKEADVKGIRIHHIPSFLDFKY